ncbi:hypothetical protein PKCBPO_01097 [Methylorubrum thiocyanatum]
MLPGLRRDLHGDVLRGRRVAGAVARSAGRGVHRWHRANGGQPQSTRCRGSAERAARSHRLDRCRWPRRRGSECAAAGRRRPARRPMRTRFRFIELASVKGAGRVKTRAHPKSVEQTSTWPAFRHTRCSSDACGPVSKAQIRMREGKILPQPSRFHTASVGSGPRPFTQERTLRIRPNPGAGGAVGVPPKQTFVSRPTLRLGVESCRFQCKLPAWFFRFLTPSYFGAERLRAARGMAAVSI